MKSNYVYLIIILVIIMYPVIVNCTRCYICRSDKHDRCDAKTTDEAYLDECPAVSKLRAYSDVDLPEGVIGNVVICRKVLQSLKFINNTKTTIVARECTVIHKEADGCFVDMTPAFQLTICECRTDGCNRAANIRSVPWILTLISVVIRNIAEIFPT